MLCRVFRIALMLTPAILFAGPGLAQPPGQAPAPTGGVAMGMIRGRNVFRVPGVQKELKLSADQTKLSNNLPRAIMAKHKEDIAKAREAEPAVRSQKMQELYNTLAAEIENSLEQILKPEQLKRVKQIELQQRNVRAFEDPKVQKTLNLTAEQNQKLEAVSEGYIKEIGELERNMFSPATGGVNSETRTKMTAVRTAAMEKALATLTDNQKKQWKEMTGEPFTVTYPANARPSGRIGGRR